MQRCKGSKLLSTDLSCFFDVTDRPDAHIFCVVYDEGCMSAEDSETNRIHVSLQLQEIVKVAMSKVNKHDPKMHYAFIKVCVLSMHPEKRAWKRVCNTK